MGECFQWKAHGQCSKGDSCSFSHDTMASGNSGKGQRPKGRSCSPALNSKAKTHGKEGTRDESSDKRRQILCRYKNCKNPSCKFWHSLVCQNDNSETGCKFGKYVSSDMLWLRRSPARSQRKVVPKGSVALLKESTQLGCVSQDSYPRKYFLRGPGRLGSKHAVKFSKGTWHQIKLSRGIIQKCALHERGPCASKFEERSHEETLKHIYKLNKSDKATFYFSNGDIENKEMIVVPAHTSKRSEEREFVVDPGALIHMMSKRDLSSDELDTF